MIKTVKELELIDKFCVIREKILNKSLNVRLEKWLIVSNMKTQMTPYIISLIWLILLY